MTQSPKFSEDSPTGEIVIYQTDDGKTKIEVRFVNETVWLSLDQMAMLFGVDKSGISRHLRNVISSGELLEEGVVAIFATTAADGKTYQVKHYNIDAIIAVGYRVNSKRATQFRIWATSGLRQRIAVEEVFTDMRTDKRDMKVALCFWSTCLLMGVGCSRSSSSQEAASAFLPISSQDVQYVIVCEADFEAVPEFLTNATDRVYQKARYNELFRVTDREEINRLVSALNPLRGRRESGICFCGILSDQIFVSQSNQVIASTMVYHANSMVSIDKQGAIASSNGIFRLALMQTPNPEDWEKEAGYFAPCPIYAQYILQLMRERSPSEYRAHKEFLKASRANIEDIYQTPTTK